MEVSGVEPLSEEADLQASTSVVCLFHVRRSSPNRHGYNLQLADVISPRQLIGVTGGYPDIGYAHQSSPSGRLGMDGLARTLASYRAAGLSRSCESYTVAIVGIYGLLWINEGRAPRLATCDLTSPSKPCHPHKG